MIRYCFAAALMLCVTCAVAQPGNAPAPANPPGTHTLNLKEADIQALIATVSEITGKNLSSVRTCPARSPWFRHTR